MNFEKKCKKCGTIQEHSLQQNCPNCGTKNAFTEEKEKIKEKTIKKCKNCGTIQEHSLQSICPKCGTKNAFNNSNITNSNKITVKKCKNCGTIQEYPLQQACPKCGTKNAFDVYDEIILNYDKISKELGKDFICPKCLSFFGKENVPKKMLKKEPIGCFLITPAFFLAIPTALIYLSLSRQSLHFFEAHISFTILIFFILFVVYKNKESTKKCPVCGRKGEFILADSKLGMKYVNKKIIKETVETNKDINSNSERQNNTINDIFSSWNADKK